MEEKTFEDSFKRKKGWEREKKQKFDLLYKKVSKIREKLKND